jgi:hypothetical protein
LLEVGQPLLPWEAGGLEPAGGAASVPVVALGEQQLGQESCVGELFPLRCGCYFTGRARIVGCRSIRQA